MEIEAKFRVPNRVVHRQLLRLRSLAGYPLAPLGRVQVVDRYFDTADRRLLAASVACRVRTQGDQVIATLKGMAGAEGAVHRRAEQEVSLPEVVLDPVDWPESEARRWALELAAGAELEPLVDLEQTRAKRNLMDGSRRVAEVSLDEVRARTGKRPSCYYEIEVELAPDGAEAELLRVSAALENEYGLAPENCSKFERALGAARRRDAIPASYRACAGAVESPAADEAPQLAPDDSMSEAGRKVIYTHFTRMLAKEDGTRKGEDIEFLHDMRVATRRMRAAFHIFEPFYTDDAVKQFNKGLRRAGRTLGAVRDLDVLIEKCEGYQAGLPPDGGLTVQPLLESWQTNRDAARRELAEYLDGPVYRTFVEEFREFLTTPGAQAIRIPEGQPIAHQVRHIVPRLVMERYEQVRAYEPILAGAPLTTYHLLRIDCKRLRYALEFFEPLLGPGAPALIQQVTGLQDLLGAMHDAYVAEGLIATFLEQRPPGQRKKKAPAPAPIPAQPGVEAYHHVQQQVQVDLLAQFPEPWALLTGPDFRRELGMALATP